MARLMEVPQIERVVLDLAYIRWRVRCGAGLELYDDDALARQNHSIEAALQPEERVLQEQAPSCSGGGSLGGSLQRVTEDV